MNSEYFTMEDNELVQAGYFEEDNKEKPIIWTGWLNCFSNVVNIFSADSKDDSEHPWEVPFESIKNLTYLGSGAQGVVFGGQIDGEMVAVKKVREEWETNIKHLRKLNHENIVRFKGICVERPYYCVVMEYCQYGSMFEFLHSGTKLMPKQLMKWAKDIALGVNYLHSHKIIHRDLKSPNVLIADGLTAKVSDFGTSREWDNVSTVMSFTGTVAWMAPEVIRHEPCSERVDVWSYGVVLWEMLTRQIPFKNMETHAIMWGVGTDTLSLPVPTTCPNSLQVLLCQTWHRVPKNRPPFKIIAAHLDMAAKDILATDPESFAAKQEMWGLEVDEGMERIFARNEKQVCQSSAGASERPAAAPRDDLRHVKQIYEQQLSRANELFMEVCTVRLQLEQRECLLAEREKMLKSCRCGQRKSVKLNRQASSSSDGKPVVFGGDQPRKKKESQLLVNYIDKADGFTYTVALEPCVCSETIQNNNFGTAFNKEAIVAKDTAGFKNTAVAKDTANVKDTAVDKDTAVGKDTFVEKNGNVEIQTNKGNALHDIRIPDVAQV